MRIDNSLPIDSSRKIESNEGLPTARKTQLQNPKDATVDSSSLSASSQKVLDLQAAAQHLPEIRQEKVDPLKKQVDAGTYHPTLEEITQAVMNDLLGIQK